MVPGTPTRFRERGRVEGQPLRPRARAALQLGFRLHLVAVEGVIFLLGVQLPQPAGHSRHRSHANVCPEFLPSRSSSPGPQKWCKCTGRECMASSSGSHSSLRPQKCLAFQVLLPALRKLQAREQETPRAQPRESRALATGRMSWGSRRCWRGRSGGEMRVGRPKLVPANPRRRDCTWAART